MDEESLKIRFNDREHARALDLSARSPERPYLFKWANLAGLLSEDGLRVSWRAAARWERA